jgi:metal transporter CNNM
MYEKDHFLNAAERKRLTAALEMESKTANDVMTPMDKVFMLDIETKLDYSTLKIIYESGYSRIPIYEYNRQNLVGILMTRDLVLINPENNLITIRQLSSIFTKNVVQIQATTKLEPILSLFKKGLCHMAVIYNVKVSDDRDPEYMKVGILTLEDIIEQIL